MRILGVDTAGASCSAAIVDHESMLAEINFDTRQNHSKYLIEIINTVLKLADIQVSELDGFAVTRGPGTFTGLRIGLSTVKGLAAPFSKPIVAISSLKALAMPIPCTTSLICPMIDARRGEVYTTLYRVKNGILTDEQKEAVLPPHQAVRNISEPCVFVGSGAALYEKIILDDIGDLSVFPGAEHNNIRASTIARIGLNRIKNSDIDDISTLVPSYIRKSDAELNFNRSSQ